MDAAWDEASSLIDSLVTSVGADHDGKLPVGGETFRLAFERLLDARKRWEKEQSAQFPLQDGGFSFFLS